MRPLVLAMLLVACGPLAPSGTLGLPSPLPSASASPPARTATPSASATASASPSASPSASASPSPTASPSAAPTATPPPRDTTPPGIVAASASQLTLTVVFSEPMRSGLPCGATGPATGPQGAIDRGSGAASHYRATDAYDETLRSAYEARVNADCTMVMFLYRLAAPAGTFTVAVSAVQDLAGNPIDAARAQARVTIADLGRPQVTGAESLGDSIHVTFSEPMLRTGEGGGVTLEGNYRLDGAAPRLLGTGITCDDEGCRSVRLWLLPGTLTPGRTYTLRVANVVDRAGLTISPDPTTLTFIARDAEGRVPTPSPTRSP